jgi:hypothetical protein
MRLVHRLTDALATRDLGADMGYITVGTVERAAAEASKEIETVRFGPLAFQIDPEIAPMTEATLRRQAEEERAGAILRLEVREWRLHELATWTKDDPDLLKDIDDAIKQRMRQQRWITFGTYVVTLISGWLLSAVAPASVLAHLFGR